MGVTDFPNAEGKFVYGGALQARLKVVLERHGKDGLKKMIKDMKKAGYSAPKEIDSIKAKGKYPLTDFLILLYTYRDIYGRRALDEMSRQAPKKKGIVGAFLKWAGTPKLLIRKAGEYWPQFYTFGELNGSVITDTKGLLIGNGICSDELMCDSLSEYFRGVLENAKVKNVKCEHSKCELKGEKIGKWVLTWK
jgi:predicted hydrocarbon binding protein